MAVNVGNVQGFMKPVLGQQIRKWALAARLSDNGIHDERGYRCPASLGLELIAADAHWWLASGLVQLPANQVCS
jgi:hypothetical protein